jgi:hypothetical protein
MSSSESKVPQIACGVLMTLPLYVTYSYFMRDSDREDWSSILYRGARHTCIMSTVFLFIASAEIGTFYVADGIYKMTTH